MYGYSDCYAKQNQFSRLCKLTEYNACGRGDLAYWNENEVEYAVCCIVLVDYNTKDIVESKYCIDKVVTPYIPGCLAFR